MNVSVLIPTYNSSATIEATVDSVISQTSPASEILILDDGSTDNTLNLLERYQKSVTVFQQRNQGVAQSRNVLAQRAQGELLAFLDHDDLWHPDYLATQQKLFRTHPQGKAFFTGHDNFYGHGGYDWKATATAAAVEVIAPLAFFQRYHKAPGPFASMSFVCIPKRSLQELGSEPFYTQVSGVDDYHLFHKLLLLGPVVYDPTPLVAYRITGGAQSANLLKAVGKAVRALESLEPLFKKQPDSRLRSAFDGAFSAQRREYGKILMGAGRPEEARKQLRLSLAHSRHPKSLMKSLVLLFLTGAPKRFQPSWPSEWKASHSV